MDMETMHTALAMALHNLCVRNNINPYDLIETMKEQKEKLKHDTKNNKNNM